MKILAIEHELPNIPAEKFKHLARLESVRAWELYQQNIIREIYFRSDRSEAVLVLEADSLESAEKILDTLPLVKEACITFELIPLTAYPGFERLFAKEK